MWPAAPTRGGAVYHRPMPDPRRRDPLQGIDRLLVDANNLLGAMARRPEPVPAAALIGRLRAAIPTAVAIELVFDGPPVGRAGRRIAAGVTVRYAGTRSADALLQALVEAAGPVGLAGAPATLIVTDDAALRRSLHERGAATVRTAWLIDRLSRTRAAAPTIGNRRPPATASGIEGHETASWRPGRGATRKRGPARRAPRDRGTGRMPA